ncbi:hypothetical protein [Photobacterium carnosum]|uniref:hypothetical protein n=1 Tax=Photobacterium carnosum TaxID=2023717 RepID=UPI00128BB113|nr:hypothetical protein [Photobacterium carnosum]KAE8178417.1 hypothetical protein CIT27_01200 [Photobacterium carnosum]MCD9526662.1 hypothetical protein [Photobacterium carnosum]
MAAQKLTRGRLIQIIILMIILISAFVWRTVTYKSNTTVQRSVCNLNTGNCFFNINNKKIIVSLSQTKLQANTLVELYINPVDINPSASVSGVTMNMGILPIIFTQQKDGWVGKFTVPQSTHNKMTWNIDIKINQNIYSSEFTVTK